MQVSKSASINLKYLKSVEPYFNGVMVLNLKDGEKEYMSYVWDEDAQKLGKDKPLKTHDHTCDCDRYVIYTESLNGLSGVYK